MLYGVKALNTIGENLINNSQNSELTNSQKELVGGINQEWKNIIKKISQKQVEHALHGDIMRNLAYELKNIKRTEFPIFLDPKTASFVDVGIHAKIRQYLSDSTIEKNLRYARFMEKHPCPVDFRNLTAENFLTYFPQF
jgi:maltooligosyltrehalose synthase